MRPNECIIVWCDSPLGLISTRVDENNIPVHYLENEINPEVIPILDSQMAIFDTLGKKDGTKIAIPTRTVPYTLGWDLNA